jgi:hypothetical protein
MITAREHAASAAQIQPDTFIARRRDVDQFLEFVGAYARRP